MIGGMKAIKTLVVTAAVIAWLTVPTYPQGFGKREDGPGSGYPVESHPKADEKSYKAALDRIPTPGQKYDPWGIARSAEPATTAKNPNQG